MCADRYEKIFLEERLVEAVCINDIDTVRKLINLGANINRQERLSGWTALHWACSKGRVEIAALLLKNGANKKLRTENGETPACVCRYKEILDLLNTSTNAQRIMNDSLHTATSTDIATSTNTQTDFLHVANPLKTKNNVHDEGRSITSFQDELVLKIRIANSTDSDFIEVELPRNELTYEALLFLCCEELELNPSHVQKLRKLPNTKLRKDKDIQRLQNLQEIEIVMDVTDMSNSMQNANGLTTNLPTLPANGYQSISKKNQTILY